jgi:hypothetical protein
MGPLVSRPWPMAKLRDSSTVPSFLPLHLLTFSRPLQRLPTLGLRSLFAVSYQPFTESLSLCSSLTTQDSLIRVIKKTGRKVEWVELLCAMPRVYECVRVFAFPCAFFCATACDPQEPVRLDTCM